MWAQRAAIGPSPRAASVAAVAASADGGGGSASAVRATGGAPLAVADDGTERHGERGELFALARDQRASWFGGSWPLTTQKHCSATTATLTSTLPRCATAGAAASPRCVDGCEQRRATTMPPRRALKS